MRSSDDPDATAQRIVNAWGVNMRAGSAGLISPQVKGLFETPVVIERQDE